MFDNRYTQPEKGDEDWHKPLNENFKRLGTDVEIRDEEENLDEYEPKVGAKFFATDSGNVYIGIEDDGDLEWDLVTRPDNVGSSGELPVYDIRDYGATEGASQDNSRPIENAIEDAAGGGIVYIPEGEWGVSEITISDGVSEWTMRGEGYGSVIVGDGSNRCINTSSDGDPISHVTLRDFRVRNGSRNIELSRNDNEGDVGWQLHNLWVHGSTSGTGLDITAQHVRVSNIFAWENETHGVSFSDTQGDTEHGYDWQEEKRIATNIIAWDNGQSGKSGYGINTSNGHIVLNGFASFNNHRGIKVSSRRGTAIIANGWLYGNRVQGMRTTTGSAERHTIVDNIVSAKNGDHGFDFGGDAGAKWYIGTLYAYENEVRGFEFGDNAVVYANTIVAVDNAERGIYLSSGSERPDITIDKVHIEGNGRSGIDHHSEPTIRIYGGKIIDNGEDGIDLGSDATFQFRDLEVSGNSDSDLSISSRASGELTNVSAATASDMSETVWVNGMAETDGSPDATNYREGMHVIDGSDLYLITDSTSSSGYVQLG